VLASRLRRWRHIVRLNARIIRLLGLRSYLRFRRVFFPLYKQRKVPLSPKPISLRIRALGRTVLLRPGTSDGEVVWETFQGLYHLPPPSVGEPALIWDLGANIGLTAAHFAHLFPRTRIIGVELDAGNAALARANLAPWSARCELITAAVWPEDGEVSYDPVPGTEYALRVKSGPGGESTAPALSLNSLLARSGASTIDFVKMDIEGAERRVLRENTQWAEFVRSIKVEVHEPYETEECARDLEELGFVIRLDDRHWACVMGERP
jgi:FkbM family methyltransferase